MKDYEPKKMSTKDALDTLREAVERVNEGYNESDLYTHASGLVMLGDLEKWLVNFIEQVGDVRAGSVESLMGD